MRFSPKPNSPGSPPHTRGKVHALLAEAELPGITPAHAGKSIPRRAFCRCGKDHPRTRGEKDIWLFKNSSSEGSPPHTRGKDFTVMRYLTFRRGSPPHTRGKARYRMKTKKSLGSPPHTRGKVHDPLPLVCDRGSPPHTRGKVSRTQTRKRGTRITPAHAGKRLNKPPYYGHSSAAGHRISFNFPMSSYVSRQSVKALCAPRISIPKYSQSAVSVY